MMIYLIICMIWLVHTATSQPQSTRLSRSQMDMRNFPNELKRISSSLREKELDIANKLDKLAETAADTSKQFTETVSKRGLEMLSKVKDLTKGEITLKDVDSFSALLADSKSDLSTINQKIRKLETDINDNIETMRERKQSIIFDAKEREEIAKFKEEESIKLYESIESHESNADYNDREANDYRIMSNRKEDDAGTDIAWSVLWGLAGLAAGPWAGLYYVAAPLWLASGKKFIDSADSKSKAEIFAREARKFRQKASELRWEADNLRTEKGTFDKEAEKLRHTAEELEKAAQQLELASTYLVDSLGVTEGMMKAVQNTEATINRAELSGGTMNHVLSDRQLSDHDPTAAELLSKFRDSLNALETFLVQQTRRGLVGTKEEKDRD